MTSGPITSWQIDGETMWETLFSWAPKSDGDCIHEIKKHLLLVRKAMTNLDSILKSRDITLQTKFHIAKVIVFPVVMYGCESWTINKAERWRTDALEMMLEKTLESPLDCKESQPVHPKGDQSWVFIGRTDAEAETPILWPPDEKNWLIEKTLMLGKIEGRRRRGWQRMRFGWMASLTQWTWVWVNSRRWWWTGRPGMLQSMGSKSQTQLGDWTELTELI